jgi:hypothetical protein
MLPAHWTGVGFAEPGLQAGLVEVVLTSDLQGITVGLRMQEIQYKME